MEIELANENTHFCLFCCKPINPTKGRENRKYCDDICKSRYHNMLRRGIDGEIKRINKILYKNFEILKEVYERSVKEKEPASISITDLYRLGFSFDYYTQVSGSYKFCYYYGYVPGNNEKYMKIVVGFDSIVKKI